MVAAPFHFEGQTDQDAFESADDPEPWAGAQVLYIPENTPVFLTDAPPDLEVFPRVDLAADTEQSAPDPWLPQTRRALLGDGRDWPDHPRETPAELKPFPSSTATANMTWGDAGTLYWLIRPEDLAAHRFDQARLTVQC